MHHARPVALSLAAICFSALAAHAGTYEGFYLGSSNVGLDWSSDLGSDYSGTWNFVGNGPHAGDFVSFTERDFGGYSGIGYLSARCNGNLPAVGSPSPGHLHFASDLVVHDYGGYGIGARSESAGHAYTSGAACYWKLNWSVTYDSDYRGNMQVVIYEPFFGWHYPVAGDYFGGARMSGSYSGHYNYGEAYFVANASLYQGQAYPAAGHMTFTVDIRISDAAIPACPADFNNDGQVDDADFILFVVGYNILDCSDPTMPSNCPADINADGVVDDSDFPLFVVAYNELVCP